MSVDYNAKILNLSVGTKLLHKINEEAISLNGVIGQISEIVFVDYEDTLYRYRLDGGVWVISQNIDGIERLMWGGSEFIPLDYSTLFSEDGGE